MGLSIRLEVQIYVNLDKETNEIFALKKIRLES